MVYLGDLLVRRIMMVSILLDMSRRVARVSTWVFSRVVVSTVLIVICVFRLDFGFYPRGKP